MEHWTDGQDVYIDPINGTHPTKAMMIDFWHEKGLSMAERWGIVRAFDLNEDNYFLIWDSFGVRKKGKKWIVDASCQS